MWPALIFPTSFKLGHGMKSISKAGARGQICYSKLQWPWKWWHAMGTNSLWDLNHRMGWGASVWQQKNCTLRTFKMGVQHQNLRSPDPQCFIYSTMHTLLQAYYFPSINVLKVTKCFHQASGNETVSHLLVDEH